MNNKTVRIDWMRLKKFISWNIITIIIIIERKLFTEQRYVWKMIGLHFNFLIAWVTEDQVSTLGGTFSAICTVRLLSIAFTWEFIWWRIAFIVCSWETKKCSNGDKINGLPILLQLTIFFHVIYKKASLHNKTQTKSNRFAL